MNGGTRGRRRPRSRARTRGRQHHRRPGETNGEDTWCQSHRVLPKGCCVAHSLEVCVVHSVVHAWHPSGIVRGRSGVSPEVPVQECSFTRVQFLLDMLPAPPKNAARAAPKGGAPALVMLELATGHFEASNRRPSLLVTCVACSHSTEKATCGNQPTRRLFLGGTPRVAWGHFPRRSPVTSHMSQLAGNWDH